jgi:hypothetical protein
MQTYFTRIIPFNMQKLNFQLQDIRASLMLENIVDEH